MDREQQVEYLTERLKELLNDNEENPIKICHVEKELFIEMAFCFIAKHRK